MRRMIYYLIAFIATIIVITSSCKSANSKKKWAQKSIEYKFLFRNNITSIKKKDPSAEKSVYQLAPVMRGNAYRPYYIYMPKREQYLVCSRLELHEVRRQDVYAPPHKSEVKRHVLMDKKGQIIRRLDSKFHYSINTGKFFTPNFYMNWLESGDTSEISYAGIYNKDVKMSRIQFADTFRTLYAKADYIEYVNLRTDFDDNIGSGVVFKVDEKWHILLNGVDHSNLYAGNPDENEKTGVDNYEYRLIFDYYDPDKKKTKPYPQSPALIQSTYLETNDPNPYRFYRRENHDGLKLKKYNKQSSTGWQGIAAIKGIPIFVPGTGEGIAYMEIDLGEDIIRFKVPNVTKFDYRSVYNIGIRTFKIPSHYNVNNSLTFLESTQNFAHYNRDGGGVYVIRPCDSNESKTSDFPEGICESRYEQLPLSLQVALLDIENTTALKTSTWNPEIEHLVHLKYLRIDGWTNEIPDGISSLQNLEVLIIKGCRIQMISPKIAKLKKLKILNLYSNQLTSFPKGICELMELRDLDIGANKIHEIPDCITNLKKLHSLRMLLLNNVSLPDSIANMKDLRIKRAEELKGDYPEKFHFLFED